MVVGFSTWLISRFDSSDRIGLPFDLPGLYRSRNSCFAGRGKSFAKPHPVKAGKRKKSDRGEISLLKKPAICCAALNNLGEVAIQVNMFKPNLRYPGAFGFFRPRAVSPERKLKMR